MKHFVIIDGDKVILRNFKDRSEGLNWCTSFCDNKSDVLLHEFEELEIMGIEINKFRNYPYKVNLNDK